MEVNDSVIPKISKRINDVSTSPFLVLKGEFEEQGLINFVIEI